MLLTPTQAPNAQDSDEDMEWEDVPIQHRSGTTQEEGISLSLPSTAPPAAGQSDRDTLSSEPVSLPAQRDEPIPRGSKEESQIRNRLSAGIERIQNRSVKTKLNIFLENAPPSERGYDSYMELAQDIEHLVDMLWTTATAVLQVEGLITLAGMASSYLPDYPFDTHHTLRLLNKFDTIFVALCTGKHPFTNLPLPGSGDGQSPLVTQTQKVRIKSLAEQSRSMVFMTLNSDNNDNENEYDGAIDEDLVDLDDSKRLDDARDEKWTPEVSTVYVKIITLLSDEFETELQ